MGKIRSLSTSMLKTGVIGFGGGNALIPVIEQEVVNEKKLVSKGQYDKDIIAATLTPGALPLEIASGVGYQCAGIRGMLAGGICMALPGTILTVFLLSGLRFLDSVLLRQIQYASVGITAFIMCLLTEYILGTLKLYRKSRYRVFLWCIIVGVFLLTGGNTICQIFHAGFSVPRFSTIEVLLVTLLGAIVYGLRPQGKKKKKKKFKAIQFRPMAGGVGIWFLFFIVLSIPAFLLIPVGTAGFDLHAIISSLLSFGGGDAYLTIADGLFVPDFISGNEFYNHLVLIVNVLPGSILCKTLSGIGYAYGEAVGGSVWAGYAMALAGFACSIAASCGIFFVIYHVYEWLERINVFVIIKKVIRVIVSGLLLTVMAGLIKSGIEMNSNEQMPWFTVLAIIFIIYALNLFLYHKGKCKNLAMILISFTLSIVVCNVIGM